MIDPCKDCIAMPDGKLICYDKESGKFKMLVDKEITLDTIPKDMIVKLMKQVYTGVVE